MPRITVLTITNRDLYLKEQIEALKSQTFQDFEWVVVDGKYYEHLWLNNAFSFPITHIGDREKNDYHSGGQAYNWGIVHSRGELVYFMADYILPHPKCLERHWYIYSKYKDVFISGKSARVDMTPAEFDSLSGTTIPAKDYRTGLIRDMTEIEDRLYLVKNSMSQTWWSSRNDSAPLEALLDCNGFEEDLDGRWGGHDGELANRMVTKGLMYLYDTESKCIEFIHETGGGGAIRSHDEQLELASRLSTDKRKEMIITSNLQRSLREERKCLLA